MEREKYYKKYWPRIRDIWQGEGLQGTTSAIWGRLGGFKGIFSACWGRFWMFFAGSGLFGRTATRLATWFTAPYFGRKYLARLYSKGYIAPNATIHHSDLTLGANVCINDRVTIYQDIDGGSVKLGNRVFLHSDCIIQTSGGGSVIVGDETHIHPHCVLSACKSPIQIGRRVLIAPNCGFYPYDHGIAPDEIIRKQPLKTKGGIAIGNDCWLGFGVVVLDGVKIGSGAVIGAGSVVTKDIPDNAVAVGVPARIVKLRGELR